MADLELFSRVAGEVASVLRCDVTRISRATCAEDIKSWDSLNNVKLLIHLERKFDIRFAGIEATTLQNVGELVDLIAVKLGQLFNHKM